MKNVWVVMGNDYPSCVFSSEIDADKYIALRKKEPPMHRHGPGIHWRHYVFEVDDQKEFIK